MGEPRSSRWHRVGWLALAVGVVGLLGCHGGLVLFGDQPKNGIRG